MAQSERFLLRLEPLLREKIARYAHQKKISINQACHTLLESGLNSEVDLKTEQSIVHDLQTLYQADDLQALILFGSIARGTATPESDYDLLLIFGNGTPIQRSLYKKFENAPLFENLMKSLGRELNIQCVHYPESENDVGSLWREVALEGRILWARDKLGVAQLLSSIRSSLLEGKSIRKMYHGQPYWIHQTSETE